MTSTTFLRGEGYGGQSGTIESNRLSKQPNHFHSLCLCDFISTRHSHFHSIFIHNNGLQVSLSTCQHISAMSKRKEGAGSNDVPHDLSAPSGSKRPRNSNPLGFRPARSRESEAAPTPGSAPTSTKSRRSGFRPARSRGTESAPTTDLSSVPTTSRVTTIALGRRGVKHKYRSRIEAADQTASTPASSLSSVDDAGPDATIFEGEDQSLNASTVDEGIKRKRNNNAQVSTFSNCCFGPPEWLYFKV